MEIKQLTDQIDSTSKGIIEDRTRIADLKLRMLRNQLQGRDNRLLFRRLNDTIREIKGQVHPNELNRHTRNYLQLPNITTLVSGFEEQLETLEAELWLNMSNYRDESQQYTQGQ